jgi:hypothetical protein
VEDFKPVSKTPKAKHAATKKRKRVLGMISKVYTTPADELRVTADERYS